MDRTIVSGPRGAEALRYWVRRRTAGWGAGEAVDVGAELRTPRP